MGVSLTVIDGPHAGRSFEFGEHDTFIVGRSKDCHFRLAFKDNAFSRFHFMVEVNPPCCRVMDMASTNGTFVNGRKVSTIDLADGDEIRAGRTVFVVAIERGPRESDTNGAGASDLDQTSSSGRDGQSAPTFAWQSASELPVVPGFRIERELGKGGMGTVYLAHDNSTGEPVAIKTVIPAVMGSPGVIARFLREASILRNLDHPGIVRFRSIGQAGGCLYFAMDYIAGTDAGKLVKKSGPLSIRRACRIACQALEGLAFAHERGFVHRDIKPHNILLTKVDGHIVAKVADFGLARIYHSSPMSGLTMMGQTGGTTHYMPPEQIIDFRQSKPAADQYSIAATLYYLLTAHHVYDYPRDHRAALMMILNEDPVPIRSRRAEIPEALAYVIQRALSREPSNRFSDAAAMSAALRIFTA